MLGLQYAIVLVIVAGAAWVSWRKLTGRYVLRRGSKPDDCASCSSAGDHKSVDSPPRL